MKQATVNLYHDKRRGDNTLKLLVTYERKQKLFTTGYKVDVSTWERLKKNADKDAPDGKIKDDEFLALWCKLWNVPDRYKKSEPIGIVPFARNITKQLGPNFTFDSFRESLDKYGKKESQAPSDLSDVNAALLKKGQAMRNEGRIGNAINYELASKSLRRFVNSLSDEERKEFLNIPVPRKNQAEKLETILRFEHVTKAFLRQYEQWMLHFGKSPQDPKKPASPASLTTVGIYCRHLRSVFNDAISHNVINSDTYPFGKNGYTIPAGTNVKKAISVDDIHKLMTFECEPGSSMERSRDLWVFSYLSNGMNMTDICNLKWKDIDKEGNCLNFVRQKTARSRKGNQQNIRVHLFPESWSIIERWGNQKISQIDYVFPFLNDSMSPERKKRVVQQVIKNTNTYMRKIADALGITKAVGTYVARHSFVTVLLQSGANLSFIREKVGHASSRTTEIYAGSLDGGENQEFINALLPKKQQ